MTQIFEIPENIPPATLYGDKSHGMQKAETLRWVQEHSTGSIPSKKVLQSVLERPETNIPEFLKRVNDCFFDDEDLMIGLKPKERELKIEGRYFALLTWWLREYFVITEYLIKDQILLLYQGLTMRDSMMEVLNKMLNGAEGQGLTSYESVGSPTTWITPVGTTTCELNPRDLCSKCWVLPGGYPIYLQRLIEYLKSPLYIIVKGVIC